MGTLKQALTYYYYKYSTTNPHKRAKKMKANKHFKKQGENCYIAGTANTTQPKQIELGNNVWLTANTTIHTHDMSKYVVNGEPIKEGTTKIGNNVFVGQNAIILPCLTIGNNVIIGTGSIVTKNVKNNQIIAGNPAKQIGTTNKINKKVYCYNGYKKWKVKQ